jgi:hypothetical protein
VHLQGDDFFRSLKTGRRRGWEEGAKSHHEIIFEAVSSAAAIYAAGGYFVVVDAMMRLGDLEAPKSDEQGDCQSDLG